MSDTKRTFSVVFIQAIVLALFHFYRNCIYGKNQGAKHHYFYSVGLSYKKADAAIRGKFSLDALAKTNLLQQAKNEEFQL